MSATGRPALTLALPVVAAVVLVPWTIGIATQVQHTAVGGHIRPELVALATQLPLTAVAHHWNTAWAGP